MTFRLLLALLLALSSVARADDGFAPLFDGRTLEGWRITGRPEGFVVDDGTILSVGGTGGGWLETDRDYTNFELRFDFLFSPVGNSGVRIRDAFEIQLITPWDPPSDDAHCTGSLYGHVAVLNRPDQTGGVWRTMTITADGPQIVVDVDGLRVSDAHLEDVPTLRNASLRGPIAFQDSHTGNRPDCWVRLRNLAIRDLDADPARVAANLASPDARVRDAAAQAAAYLGAAIVPAALAQASAADAALAHDGELALFKAVAGATRDEGERRRVEGALLAALARGDAARRRAAVKMLALAGGPAAADALGDALADPALAADALAALAALDGVAPAAVLIGAARDRALAPEWRVCVIDALAERELPALRRVLRELAHDAEPAVAAAALRALGRRGGGGDRDLLADIAAEGDSARRAAAVDGLLALAERWRSQRPDAARRVYDQAWGFGTPAQRQAAMVGVYQCGLALKQWDVIGGLVETLDDPLLGEQARYVLARIRDPQAAPALAAGLAAAPADARAELLALLERLDPTLARPHVLAAADSRDLATRAGAVALLARQGRAADRPRFVAAAASDDPALRSAGIDGLLALAERVRPNRPDDARALYREVLAGGPGREALRRTLAGLALVGDAADLEGVRAALGPAREEAAAAAMAIARRTDADAAVPVLVDIAKLHPPVAVRDAVTAWLSRRGIEIDAAHEQGFVTRWWIAGLFPNDGQSAYETAFAPEAGVDVTQPLEVAGAEVVWRPHHEARDGDGVVELLELFPGAVNKAAYAYAEVRSDADRDVLLKLGSDDGYVLWLNGERVSGLPTGRKLAVDEETHPARLRAGWNQILFKALNGGSRWAFVLRITDPDGKPLVLEQRVP